MAVARRTTGKYRYEETIADKAVLYISYKVAGGYFTDYAWPFFIKDYALYFCPDNWGEPKEVNNAKFKLWVKYSDLWIADIRHLSFTSFEELSNYLVKEHVVRWQGPDKGDPTALAIGNRYTVTIFNVNDPNKIYEKTIICRP